MLVTAVRPDSELYRPWSAPNYAPFLTAHPTLDHITYLLQERLFSTGVQHPVDLDRCDTDLALLRGQRQRVALGRAIVRHPKVFLFDEPLSNLDAKLRVQMRVEIKKIHARLGTTATYVTHDQIAAMTLGDPVVVMRDGVVQQVGEPLELYNALPAASLPASLARPR
jgi:ABC-type proline/glycine betaine transport system ATPase subunit